MNRALTWTIRIVGGVLATLWLYVQGVEEKESSW